MTPVIALITGLLIAAIAAAASIGYLWRVRRPQEATREGLKILSAMRWRELSNLIVDALGASGFEREPPQERAARGAQGDVVLYREGRPWLLMFRQGLGSSIGRENVEEFVRQIRVQHAAGGLLISLGRIEPAAREVVANVELVDGPELWRLVEPRLPASVTGEVDARSRATTMRNGAMALAASVVAGLALAWGLGQLSTPAGDAAPSTDIVAGAAARAGATPAPAEPEKPVAPRSEEEHRADIAREISGLPGVDRAVWSTRSTLQIFLEGPAPATDESLCAVMRTSELLRASRLQLQSPPSSGQPVRFMQCASY